MLEGSWQGRKEGSWQRLAKINWRNKQKVVHKGNFNLNEGFEICGGKENHLNILSRLSPFLS